MINPAKLLKMKSEASAMQRKLQDKKILGESKDGRIKIMMNAAQEIEELIVDEELIDPSTLEIINKGLKESFKDYQKKLHKEMMKDLDLDQIKRMLG